MLRTQRNSSLTLGVEKRVAYAPRGEREFRIWDFGFRIYGQESAVNDYVLHRTSCLERL